ncbi:hypothetical protein BDN72DRAFT_794256 [Pluteus cervinus]|uniref:Uncharacterized protein n=1 Tax=Pluteus cervinus TaxID=181527 RepID=A0ACD3B0P5_9AGAR|nr:hypothetical protein BDN72DRAFT_794256 [Pluteus cervinus]
MGLEQLRAKFAQDPTMYHPNFMGQDVGYGNIPSVKVGDLFMNRQELSDKLVHRPLQSGVGGRITDGAASVILSGGYEDDVDMGNIIEYTGAGGQDDSGWGPYPKPQTKDQPWGDSQKWLLKSYQLQKPVRVIRGAHCRSKYAPIEGFRYDGLYLVKAAYETKGKRGYRIWKFQLERTEGQKSLEELVEESCKPRQKRYTRRSRH